MKLNSGQLEAFFKTATLQSFSKAADHLGVTQSALSQRIANLESDLQVALFIRNSKGLVMTTAGEILLRHCLVQDSLEKEALSQLKNSQQELSGVIRLAAFSSVLRSVVIPALSKFLRAHPKVRLEFSSYEVSELLGVLQNGSADLVVTDFSVQRSGIVETVLGREEYVAIQSVKYPVAENLYLDQSPEDHATEAFFQFQGSFPTNFRRTYMGDTYGIITGVEQGLGKAVMSKHLLKGNKAVKIMSGYKKYYLNVRLCHFEQPYYSRLHLAVTSALTQAAGEYL